MKPWVVKIRRCVLRPVWGHQSCPWATNVFMGLSCRLKLWSLIHLDTDWFSVGKRIPGTLILRKGLIDTHFSTCVSSRWRGGLQWTTCVSILFTGITIRCTEPDVRRLTYYHEMLVALLTLNFMKYGILAFYKRFSFFHFRSKMRAQLLIPYLASFVFWMSPVIGTEAPQEGKTNCKQHTYR